MEWGTKIYMTYLRKHNIPKLARYSKSSAQRDYIAVKAYIKKEERSQINNLTLHLKELRKTMTTANKI